jgi:hypothetical protein
MRDLAASRSNRTYRREIVLLAIPILFALTGLAIRYLGYAAVAEGPEIEKFLTAMCRWDCQWYVSMAENGYHAFPTPGLTNAGNWAFFPLQPMLVAGLRTLTGLETIHAANALALFICIAAARLAWQLLGRDLKAYTLFSAFLLAGPYSIWFVNFYTEALFVFLTVSVFAALQARRFLLAGCIAALLSATRIVGALIVFAIVIDIWRAHRETGGTWRDFVPASLRRPDLLLAILVAPLGLFAYALFLHFHIGDGLAFSHVQRAWGRPTGLPPVFVWNALVSFPNEGWWPTASQILALSTLVGYALAIVLLVRRQYAMAVFALLCLTVPLFAGMASMQRFTAALAPLALVFCQLLGSRRWLFLAALLVLLASGYITTIGWLTGSLALV